MLSCLRSAPMCFLPAWAAILQRWFVLVEAPIFYWHSGSWFRVHAGINVARMRPDAFAFIRSFCKPCSLGNCSCPSLHICLWHRHFSFSLQWASLVLQVPLGSMALGNTSGQLPNISLQLTFDSPLGLAAPSPHVDSNAAELRRWATKEKNALGAGAVTLILSILGT